MLIWRGYGLLGLVIPWFCVVFLKSFFEILPFENHETLSLYGLSISCFIGGLITYLWGKKLNSVKPKILYDEERKKYIITTKHTLFWIPMQYFGIIYMILSIFLLFNKFK